MSLDDQEKIELFVASAAAVKDFATPDDVTEAEVASREMLLGDAEMSSLATANSERSRVLTLLGGPGPIVSSCAEDEKTPGHDAAGALPQTDEGKNAGTAQTCGTIFSTKREVPKMKQIIVEYVQGLPREVAKLLESMNMRDLQPLRRVAHQLRGSGGGYGFDAISVSAGKVEDSIAAGDTLVAIRIRVLSLVEVICRVEGYDDSNG
jgi:hypothetical protein